MDSGAHQLSIPVTSGYEQQYPFVIETSTRLCTFWLHRIFPAFAMPPEPSQKRLGPQIHHDTPRLCLSVIPAPQTQSIS